MDSVYSLILANIPKDATENDVKTALHGLPFLGRVRLISSSGAGPSAPSFALLHVEVPTDYDYEVEGAAPWQVLQESIEGARILIGGNPAGAEPVYPESLCTPDGLHLLAKEVTKKVIKAEEARTLEESQGKVDLETLHGILYDIRQLVERVPGKEVERILGEDPSRTHGVLEALLALGLVPGAAESMVAELSPSSQPAANRWGRNRFAGAPAPAALPTQDVAMGGAARAGMAVDPRRQVNAPPAAALPAAATSGGRWGSAQTPSVAMAAAAPPVPGPSGPVRPTMDLNGAAPVAPVAPGQANLALPPGMPIGMTPEMVQAMMVQFGGNPMLMQQQFAAPQPQQQGMLPPPQQQGMLPPPQQQGMFPPPQQQGMLPPPPPLAGGMQQQPMGYQPQQQQGFSQQPPLDPRRR